MFKMYKPPAGPFVFLPVCECEYVILTEIKKDGETGNAKDLMRVWSCRDVCGSCLTGRCSAA